jgi:outer membrane protein TolC
LSIVREIIDRQRGSLELAQALFESGKTNELDVIQARNNLAITEAAIPQLEAALRSADNRLCILLGMPPQELISQLPTASIPSVSRSVQVGVPADLLRRRPDIRRAERLVKAQSERIGIAEAALYPSLSLIGSIEWQAERFDDLFKPQSVFALISPGFSWNVLNYGRLVNGIELEQQRFYESVLAYQQAVLVAQREVEDSIIGFLKAQEQADQLAIGVSEVNAAESIAMTLYQSGAIDFNRVFVIQSLQFAQQDDLIVSRANAVLNLIGIYRSLGGGWEVRCPRGGQGIPLYSIVDEEPSRAIGDIPVVDRPSRQADDSAVFDPIIPAVPTDSEVMSSERQRLRELMDRISPEQQEERDIRGQLEELLRRRDQVPSEKPPGVGTER